MWHGVFCDTPSMSATCILCILCLVNVCMCVCVEYCVLVCPWVLWVCVCTRKAILCMENICKLSFTWGSRVHKSWSLLRFRDNGVKRLTVGLPTVCGVRELAAVWTKQSNSVSKHMHSDVIPARGEESGGSSFLYVVPVAKDVHTHLSPRMTSKTSHCYTVTIGYLVGLQQCYLREVFLIFYTFC